MFWGRAHRRGPGAIVFDGRRQRFDGRLDGALGFDAQNPWCPSGQLLDLQLNQIRITATLEC
ncbi:MAG TPA: hypothetical protein VIF61_14890 [Methylocystis sp.]|jgi:hypothetical protein